MASRAPPMDRVRISRPRWWQDGMALAAVVVSFAALVAPAAAKQPVELRIGYVEMEDDARYAGDAAHAGIEFRTLGRPLPGARLGIEDANAVGPMMGARFDLLVARADSAEALAGAVRGWAAEGARFVLADLSAERLVALADAVADRPVLLLNVSATDDRLRGADCRANVAHLVPSDSMLTDALVQYLAEKQWTRILALRGEAAADERHVEALRRSAAKFGASIVDERSFSLTADPRRRGESNVTLMTADAPAHDVVFVTDDSGEFDRYVPYRTAEPRPVVGTAGLMPQAWHWSWDRHGAPQLQHRFESLASPRRMNGAAWAAYAGVKAVMQAAMRTDPADGPAILSYLLADRMRLDASKGAPMNFRSWDRQLRQPVLLTTADATIEAAPLPQFLHRVNALDTLGVDEPETECRR